MAFAPMGTIALLNVDFDNTYKHVRYFSSETQQRGYFGMRVKKSYNEYLTIRKTLPDGGMVSSVKVSDNIDTLQGLPCNYMYYRNEHHGNKIFYAFITEMRYINENTTEIVFETDVYQTWLFDVEILPSYVIREHSASDEKGVNHAPEKFAPNDYIYTELPTSNPLASWGYLVGASENVSENDTPGAEICGIYQGLFFYYTANADTLVQLMEDLKTQGGDCIVFVALIPSMCVKNASLNGQRIVGSSATAVEQLPVTLSEEAFTLGGYVPKNNKLFSYPFYALTVSNHAGDEAEYRMEDFARGNIASFKCEADISANPSVMLYPLNYKGVAANYDAGICISGFPQISTNTDTFKLWLAKNQFGVALDIAGSVGQVAAGVFTAVGSGGTAAAIGATQIVSGVQGVLSSANTVYQASKEPNRGKTGSSQNNLLTAMKINKFSFYARTIKPELARTIDDFFTMYGYQTNQVKIPNVAVRPSFNYVETASINIVGGIPNNDMQRLKAIYNAGVTLWKHGVDVGDYAADNAAPVKEVNADA